MPNMLSLAKEHMAAFRRGNPDLFQRLYPISEEMRASADIEQTWFDLIGSVISHPYDPLLVLLLCEPSLFLPHRHGRHTLVGNSKDGKGSPGVHVEAAHDALVLRVRQTLAYCVVGEEVAAVAADTTEITDTAGSEGGETKDAEEGERAQLRKKQRSG